jgi:hypothetical protein
VGLDACCSTVISVSFLCHLVMKLLDVASNFGPAFHLSLTWFSRQGNPSVLMVVLGLLFRQSLSIAIDVF